MLSGPERQALNAIEKHLLAEDPQLCRALQMGQSATLRRWKLGTCIGGIVLGVVIVSTGLFLLSLGLMIFGSIVGSVSVLAFTRVRDERVTSGRPGHRRRDPGGDISPSRGTPA